MDQQPAGEETSCRGAMITTPPPAGDEPSADDGVLLIGASRPRPGRSGRSRNGGLNKEPYGTAGVCDIEADGGVRCLIQQAAGQDRQDGSSVAQAADGVPVRDHADEKEDDSMHCPLPTKAGQQAEEERAAGISTRTLAPSYRSGSGQPADNFVSGVMPGARGRWPPADHYRSRSRRNIDKGYGGGTVRNQLPDAEGVRFQAEDCRSMDPLHTKNMDQLPADQGETTAGLMISTSTPPPSCRSGGTTQPADNFVGGVRRASRPWDDESSGHDYQSRNQLHKGTPVDRFPPPEHQEYHGSVDKLPPAASCRSGGRPDNYFAGDYQVLRSASRPRGSTPRRADHYVRSRNWLNHHDRGYSYGSGSGSVRDLPDDQADGSSTAARAQAEDEGRPNMAHHEADDGVCFDRDGHEEDYNSMADEVDGGIRVYDNIVVGDPSGVIFGRGNFAGGRVTGRVSGNRVIR